VVPRLLLVECDVHTGSRLCDALEAAAFDVDWVADASAARSLLAKTSYSVVVLGEGPTPESLWAGLETIAHEPLEVAVLRPSCGVFERQSLVVPSVPPDGRAASRATPHALAQAEAAVTTALADLDDRKSAVDCHVVLLPGRVAAVKGASLLKLSCMEHRLMELLTRRPGALVSREAMQETLYRWGERVGRTAIESHLSGIRKKLGRHLVENVRGLGYRLSARGASEGREAGDHPEICRASGSGGRGPGSSVEITDYFSALAVTKE